MRVLLFAFLVLLTACHTDKSGGQDDGRISKTCLLPVEVYWQNTGIYLNPGDRVSLSATGTWSLEEGGESSGPEGTAGRYKSCNYGELVAQVGLHYNGMTICVGAGTSFTADSAGLLYISAWSPWNGERYLGSGSMTVKIKADGVELPTLAPDELGNADLAALGGEELELVGDHVILTVSREELLSFREDAAESLAVFDEFYRSHLELAGSPPFGGQPIRYYPDADTRALGAWAWMLSGNPIRLDPEAAYGEGFDGSNLLQSQNKANSVWGFVHELGHDFTFTNGGAYLIGPGPTEAWANIFTLYTLERLGYPEADKDEKCRDLTGFFAEGDYSDFRGDSWLPLCMLFELKEVYGWQFFKDFFSWYNALERSALPGEGATEEVRWAWLKDGLTVLAGTDLTPLFLKYHIPVQP